MRKVKIFLASSAELDSDKQLFDVFISNRNKVYHDRNIFLEMRTWKDFVSAMNATRLQERYNEYIRDCDIVVFLFHTRMGQYTLEEFEVARDQYLRSRGRGKDGQEGKKPLIYVFFKEGGEKVPAIEEFRRTTEGYGHFYDTYRTDEELTAKFGRQLDLLENTGVIRPEVIDLKKIVKYGFFFVLLPLLLLFLGTYAVRYFTPFNMTVRVDETRGIPSMPYENGTLTITYADKSETVGVGRETIVKEIPPKYKGREARLVFAADGFVTVDTLVRLRKAIDLPARRDNSLGVVFGTVKDEDNRPVAGAEISLLDLRATSDALGKFRIEIPLDKQAAEQRVSAYKEGYELWDWTGPPSNTVEWSIILRR